MRIAYAAILYFFLSVSAEDVKYASRCEVCKIVSQELKTRLLETGKNHDVIETGYSIEGKKEKRKYQTS